MAGSVPRPAGQAHSLRGRLSERPRSGDGLRLPAPAPGRSVVRSCALPSCDVLDAKLTGAGELDAEAETDPERAAPRYACLAAG